ncbi:MAG: hypothetical protein HY906_07915 [Deltaproteobacteria bacterium]|nr:hypothetical protein [Deltaproteobacteria bacterium]
MKLARATGAHYVRSTVVWLADESLRVVRMYHNFCYCTAMFRRATALGCGGFPEIDLAEDVGLFRRLEDIAPRWAFRDADWYVHRRHRTNVSRLRDGTTLETMGRRYGVEVRRSQRDVDALTRRISLLRRMRPAPAAPAGRLPADLRGLLLPPRFALSRGFSLQRVRQRPDGYVAELRSREGRPRQVPISPAAVPACEWLIEWGEEPFTLVDAIDHCGARLAVLERLVGALSGAGVLWSSSDGRRNCYLYRGHPENRGPGTGGSPRRVARAD